MESLHNRDIKSHKCETLNVVVWKELFDAFWLS